MVEGEFVFQVPPTLAVYDVVHSLLLCNVGRSFSFTEDETRRHFSYLSGTLREPVANIDNKILIIIVIIIDAVDWRRILEWILKK